MLVLALDGCRHNACILYHYYLVNIFIYQVVGRLKEKGAFLPGYIAVKNLEPFINSELREKLLKPITYIAKSGAERRGLPTELLPEICNIWLEARAKGALTERQGKVAQKAEILMRDIAFCMGHLYGFCPLLIIP